jgi:hypothetical protein
MHPPRCIEHVKLTTNKGRSIEAGNSGSKARLQTFTPPSGAHLFALRGSWDPSCGGPSVKFVWGTERCDSKVPLAKLVPLAPAVKPAVTMQVPVPTPVEVRSDVCVSVGCVRGMCTSWYCTDCA